MKIKMGQQGLFRNKIYDRNFFGMDSNKGRLLAMPKTIRLGQMWLTVTNFIAYHGMELCTSIKSLIVQAAEYTNVTMMSWL